VETSVKKDGNRKNEDKIDVSKMNIQEEDRTRYHHQTQGNSSI
jgi:hypothetical protein